MARSTTTTRLIDSSIRIILAGQAPSGAYIASPNFPSYRFAWLRDGSYCALAMDAVGHRDSAERFHDWVGSVILSQASRIHDIVARRAAGDELNVVEMLPTRYTLDGSLEREDDEPWPNFQLDGYGTWLFALESHYRGDLPVRFFAAVQLVAEYILATWSLPCYDYWEEYGDRVHTSTLASLAAGLGAAARLLGRDDLAETATLIMATIRESCIVDGHFTKGPEDDRVDASLLSLSTPFGLVGQDDAVMVRTVDAVRTALASPTGGIRRYLGDTFYGGNPWIMLTAWLGWHDRRVGQNAISARSQAWVEGQAGEGGALAEQILDEPQAPDLVDFWIKKWGPVADPLLWSHAKYILMTTESETNE
jgi:GH15 family glucan-1,4-alpha-glucosidase